MTLLINPGFELPSDSHRALVLTPNKPDQHSYWTERGEINNPAGWTAWYVHSEGQPPEHDPTNPNGWCEPETRAAPHRNPDRMHSGALGHVMFTFYRIHKGGHFQRTAAVPGQRYEFSYWAHAWTGNSDDPSESAAGRGALAWLVDDAETDAQLQATFQAGIDPTGGTDPEAATVVWGEAWCIYNVFRQLSVEAVAQAETITVFTNEVFLWPYKHCDGYIDDADLVPLVDPEPEPEPECRGVPRVDYARTYWLLPQAATQTQVQRALTLAYPTRGTVGFSADDAGLGDLDNREVRVLWFAPTDWDRDKLDAFFAEWYPGVTVIHEFVGIDPVDPQPEPPTGGEPTVYPDPGVLIGLHSQRTKDGWLDYYRKTKASAFKGFTVAQCVAAKQASPETLVIYRRHVDNDGAYINAPDLVASARALLDLYAAEFAGYSQASGMSVADILKHIDVLESVNEVIGTQDPELEPAVAFDVAFADAIRVRYGHQVSAGLLTIAVGNPHESEVVKLLPAARKAAEDGHYIGYHPYWSANTERSWLAEKWQWHAGRWCEWDRVFTAHGVYPRYYGGEGGICYAADGDSFQPNRGWKSCGSFGKYITDLVRFDRLARAWNATHGNRFRGLTVFCYGGYGWEDFDFEPGDLAELAEALA